MGQQLNPPAIPFVDLAAEWAPLKAEVMLRIQRVFEHGQFVMGPEVDELEERLSQDVGAAHAITCSSGTTSLLIALMALDIGPGDEVILPAFTFAAPLEVVLLLGAKAMLADIDPRTYNIDAGSVELLISPRTRAIIAVSLYGLPADFERLNVIADRHGIPIVEDAAQSYGATMDGKRSGHLSTIGCTSFFPTKPLGGSGDGGALFTDDIVLARRIREIRDHGQSDKYCHMRLGINGRLDSMSCAALLARIGSATKMVEQRREAARRYDELLAEIACDGDVLLPVPPGRARSAYAQYAVQVTERDAVIAAMQKVNIKVAVHYPTPLHHQPAFREKVFSQSLTTAENIARHVVCLPIYPTLTLGQQERIGAALTEACACIR